MAAVPGSIPIINCGLGINYLPERFFLNLCLLSTPPETISFSASSKLISRIITSFLGTRTINPVAGVGVDGTKTFSTSDKTIYGLVIVPELFDYDYPEYSKPFLKKGGELNVLCLPMSFSQLADYTHNLKNEEAFIGAICQQYLLGKLKGEFPKLRFGYNNKRS